MADRIEDKAGRVEVDLKNPQVIWVCGVTVDPDQSAFAAMKGSPTSNVHFSDLTKEMWSGDIDERTALANAGINKEIKVDIPIYSSRERLTTDEARKALINLNLGYGLPFVLASLQDREMRKTLSKEYGILMVTALGQEDQKLLYFEQLFHPVSYHSVTGGAHCGFMFRHTLGNWYGGDAVVGFPRVSKEQ